MRKCVLLSSAKPTNENKKGKNRIPFNCFLMKKNFGELHDRDGGPLSNFKEKKRNANPLSVLRKRSFS